MNPHKKLPIIAVCAPFLLGSVVAGETAAKGSRPVAGPVIQVKTARATVQRLAATLTAFGKVQPDPDSLTAINTGYAGQVRRLSVSLGQRVAAGETLLQLDTDPTARMTYLQAVAQVEYARKELARKRRLLSEQLATRGEVAAAEKSLQNAQTALATQRRLGTGQARPVIRAPFSGIVSSLNVALGDRVQAGATLLSLARRGDLLIALGVEPEDIERVKTGTPVRLAPVFNRIQQVNTKVSEVHGMVNPATRLIDVVVRLRGERDPFLLPGTQVQGTLTLKSIHTLAVPRSAILTGTPAAVQENQPHIGIGRASEAYLFRVVNGKAQRVNVQTGITARGLVAVKDGIRPGDRIIVLGNYELTDGARVTELKP